MSRTLPLVQRRSPESERSNVIFLRRSPTIATARRDLHVDMTEIVLLPHHAKRIGLDHGVGAVIRSAPAAATE